MESFLTEPKEKANQKMPPNNAGGKISERCTREIKYCITIMYTFQAEKRERVRGQGCMSGAPLPEALTSKFF